MNAKFKIATRKLIASLDNFSQELPAVSWWRDRLNEVLTGKRNYASDPHGYMIIGVAGNADRGSDFVWRQWRFAIVEGHTTKAHKVLRALKAQGTLEATIKAIEQGVFWSAARQNGAYGTVEARNAAMQLSTTVQQGGNIQHLLKRLQTAVINGDIAFVQRELSEIKSLGIANARLQAWIKQIESVLPEEIKPEEIKPEEIKPEEIKPEEIKPEPESKPEAVTPEEIKPEAVTPEEIKPEEIKPEEIKPEAVTPEEIKPEEIKPEEIKPSKITRKRNKKTA